MRTRIMVGLAIAPLVGLMLAVASPAFGHHVDDGSGVVISIAPQKYGFEAGEIVVLSGEVHALRNGNPVVLKVFNYKNQACDFQQVKLDEGMKFRSEPIKIYGDLCGVKGEYKVTAHYGSAKAITEFYVGNSYQEFSSGKAEVMNAKMVYNFIKSGNKYPVDLYWSTNSVLVKNNMEQTITSYIVFAEYDADEFTNDVSFVQITVKPFDIQSTSVPFVPQIIDGKPNGYLHVFAWTSLSEPTPLHPGLYVPY
jgi:hypothetical protein